MSDSLLQKSPFRGGTSFAGWTETGSRSFPIQTEDPGDSQGGKDSGARIEWKCLLRAGVTKGHAVNLEPRGWLYFDENKGLMEIFGLIKTDGKTSKKKLTAKDGKYKFGIAIRERRLQSLFQVCQFFVLRVNQVNLVSIGLSRGVFRPTLSAFESQALLMALPEFLLWI